MEDELKKQLDSLDIGETDQLLNSLGESAITNMNKNVDKDILKKIKRTTYEKMGFHAKTPLIPDKKRFFLFGLVFTIIELLFLLGWASLIWMDNLLILRDFDTYFKIAAIPLYGISLFTVYFILNSAALIMNNRKLSMKDLIPKDKNIVAFISRSIGSIALRIGTLIITIFIFTFIFKIFKSSGFFINVMFFIVLIFFQALVDMILTPFKYKSMMKNSGFSFTENDHSKVKLYFLELSKYIILIIFYKLIDSVKAIEFTSTSGLNTFSYLTLSVFLCWLINCFFILNISAKKRLIGIYEPKEADVVSTSQMSTQKEIGKIGDRLVTIGKQLVSMFRRHYIVSGMVALIMVYFCVLSVSYTINYKSDGKNPHILSFKSNAEYDNFVKNISNADDFADDIDKTAVSSAMYAINKSFFNMYGVFYSMAEGRTKYAVRSDSSPRMVTSKTKDTKEDSYSGTNRQVEEVDEADVVKTDGNYIYYLTEDKLVILSAKSSGQAKQIYSESYAEKGRDPVELFLYKDYIAVILADKYQSGTNKTIVITYNIKNPANPVVERNFEVDGYYLTSRMINNNLYLITNSYGNNLIQYTDGTINKEVSYKDSYIMKHIENGDSEDYRAYNYEEVDTITAFPVNNPAKKAVVKSYFGAGRNVYVSTNYIYILNENYNQGPEPSIRGFVDDLVGQKMAGNNYYDYFDINSNYNLNSSIFRIEIKNGTLGDYKTAQVPGRVNNQFSMDEDNGYFRLTLENEAANQTTSSVYVLDKELKVRGKLEGLAPGEHIYSSRFAKDRLYLVTFKTVDPLFVISLKNPESPELLGALKIPGYSEYIHPLDENHIIGFGKDTKEANYMYDSFGGEQSMAFYQGIKMAIFDVTDVKHPKEKFKEIIGTRGTDSELLYNHKSLMYMGNMGIMAFPITVAEDIKNDSSVTAYGKITFQGAYVYDVSSSKGFNLRGKITHLENQQIKAINESNELSTDDAFINRILYINDILYTFSSEKVKSTRYEDMNDISVTDISEPDKY